jgi:hypothetical protein
MRIFLNFSELLIKNLILHNCKIIKYFLMILCCILHHITKYECFTSNGMRVMTDCTDRKKNLTVSPKTDNTGSYTG